MEEHDKSEDIDFVVIISDKEYVHKADERTGGVGSETQLSVREFMKMLIKRNLFQ